MGPDEQDPDYRFTLANERTFLAWIRTGLALIAGGVVVVQLVPAFGYPGLRHGLGIALCAAGGILSALAVVRWRRVQTAMRRGGDLPPSTMPVVLGAAILVMALLMVVVLFVTAPGGD
ncbi:YidH family protein [Mycobacterium sp. URHB0021]